jgi:hypothetical protein
MPTTKECTTGAKQNKRNWSTMEIRICGVPPTRRSNEELVE